MTCICKSIPRNKRGEVTTSVGVLIYAFHVDCPEHGVIRSAETIPMKRIIKSNWVTKAEAITNVGFYRSKEGLKIANRTQDGEQALLEWIEWEPME